jgi:hypothetical protein
MPPAMASHIAIVSAFFLRTVHPHGADRPSVRDNDKIGHGLFRQRHPFQRNKSPAGMQHDEYKSSFFKYAGRRDRVPP